MAALLSGCVLAMGGLAACGSTANPAYQMLQEAMKQHITDVDHRPVDTVACLPHVTDTVREEKVHLRCLVHFVDGSSYEASATIQDENFGGAHNLPDSFSWDAPPG